MLIKTLALGCLIMGTLVSCQQTESLHEAEQKVNDAAKNKRIVWEFYQGLFGDKDLTAIDSFIDRDYIQHNPNVADGAVAFKLAAAEWFKGSPKEKVDVQRIAAEGDLVFIHVKNKTRNGSLRSTIDIFRLQNAKIMEHWDVQEDVPETSANSHPMF